jgi:hypothetical protein
MEMARSHRRIGEEWGHMCKDQQPIPLIETMNSCAKIEKITVVVVVDFVGFVVTECIPYRRMATESVIAGMIVIELHKFVECMVRREKSITR